MDSALTIEQIPPISEQITEQGAVQVANPEPKAPFGGRRFSFTPEQARAARAKRTELIRAKAIENQPTLEQNPTAQSPAEQTGAYLSEQLARVRKHLDRVDAQMEKAKDPLDVERLARARNTLAEQERILAGRPLPGSHRPTAPRGRGSAASVEPI